VSRLSCWYIQNNKMYHSDKMKYQSLQYNRQRRLYWNSAHSLKGNKNNGYIDFNALWWLFHKNMTYWKVGKSIFSIINLDLTIYSTRNNSQ
jgi:hypothetical protein